MEEKIRKIVGEKLAEMGAGEVAFAVELPADLTHGDYAVNAALAASKKLGKNPKEIAEELAAALRAALGSDASSVEVAGPGFVNITLSQQAIAREMQSALADGEQWGKGEANKGVCVMLEYTDPNPFKEMHIGHLMSNAIGESLSRLVEFSGAEVARTNYEGDVGPHVAKALWGMKKLGGSVTPKTLGEAYALGARAYEDEPRAKEEIDAINKAVYTKSDPEITKLWEEGRTVSLAAFEEIYKKLGTHFDFYTFESEVAGPGAEMTRDGLAKGVFEESDGAIVYKGEKRGLHTRVFITRAGNPTYEAKELALPALKEKHWPHDRSIIITAAEQTGHFEVVLAALEELAPEEAKKITHIPHGFMKLPTGKMSSRTGDVVTAESLLEKVIAKAGERSEDAATAEAVGMGAIKYMILRQAPGSDIVFDEEKSLSLEGDSGPYLQYALVRAKSIIARASSVEAEGLRPTMMKLESRNEPYTIERLLVRFPEVAARAERALAPNQVVTYLTELAAAWNRFYAEEQIIGDPHEAHKLMVARVFAQTMANGLWLLGIKAPEKM